MATLNSAFLCLCLASLFFTIIVFIYPNQTLVLKIKAFGSWHPFFLGYRRFREKKAMPLKIEGFKKLDVKIRGAPS